MINKLTQKQEAALSKYRDEGISIGLDTNDEYDFEVVKELIGKFREKNKLKPAKRWIQVDSPYEASEKYGARPHQALYGCHDIYWLQAYHYFRNELGLTKQTEPVVELRQLAEMIGWFWLSEDSVLISRKPCHLGLSYRKSGDNTVPVPHDPDQMAIRYRDNTGVYMMDGVEMPAWLYEDKESRTPEKILAIKNVDVRNAALKLLGPDGLISVLPHDIIEEKTITVKHTPNGSLGAEYNDLAQLFGTDMSTYQDVATTYRLIGFKLNGVYRIYLNGVCPSKGEKFTEAVHPECNTIAKALNWRETGVVGDEYMTPVVRT